MQLVYGFGINDAGYPVSPRDEDGKRITCPYYSRWISIMQRGNDPKEKLRKPSYADVFVSGDWRKFSDFKAWLDTQTGWQTLELDKDILVKGNLEYGPDTCCFVPKYINRLFAVHKTTGACLHGVGKVRNRYKAMYNRSTLGTFDTEQAAHKAWQTERVSRLEAALVSYGKETYFDSRVAEAISNQLWLLMLDMQENRTTTYP
jgi:hypothetical protein